MTANSAVPHSNDLVITRLITASAHVLFRCWTEPELLKQWFVPKPWTIARAEVDLRPGGQSLIVMRDPDGNEFPNPGVYLDVVADRGEHARHEVVDADRHVLNVVQLFLAAPVEAGDMLLGDERVAERVLIDAPVEIGGRALGRVAIRRDMRTGDLLRQVTWSRAARHDDEHARAYAQVLHDDLAEQVGLT